MITYSSTSLGLTSFQKSASSDFKKSSAIFLIKISSYFSALWNTKTPCFSYLIIIYIILPCIILNCFHPSYDKVIWTSFYTIDMYALNMDFFNWIEYLPFVSAYRKHLVFSLLKFQYFDHLMGRADSLEKTLMLGKIEGKRRRGWQRMRWLDSTTDSMDISLSNLREIVEDRGAWHATVHGVPKSRTQLSK